MSEVRLTRQLNEQGLGRDELRRLVRTRQLERVRRGAYAVPAAEDRTRAEEHRRRIDATLPGLDPGAALSHGSAAVLLGLPTWPGWLERVHITRSRSTGGQRRRDVHVHVAPLAEADLIVVEGIVMTSLARTVLDLARSTPFHQSVAAGDRALALGLDPNALAVRLLGMTHWPGVRAARRSCAFLDARSESAGESASRVRFLEQGIPAPETQYELLDGGGVLVARGDFGWEQHRTIGEFDGRTKYGRLVPDGRTTADVVYDEKLREDAIRDQGWQVVRWIWADLYRPQVIRDRVLRAFDRNEGTPRRC